MDFETSLLNGIPLEEAADFFLRVRGKDKAATVADLEAAFADLTEDDRTALKVAMGAGGAMPPSPGMLPPTGRGQNMQATPPPPLPPTAQGMQTGAKMAASYKSPEDTGKERAKASISAEFEKDKAHGKERTGDAVGRTLGALAGGAAMHRYGKGNPMATLGGVALGQHMGGKAGRGAGAALDRHAHEKAAAAFKLALLDGGLSSSMEQQEPAPSNAAPAPKPGQPIEPAIDPAMQEYLAQEEAAEAAGQENQAAFLRQKLQEAQAELQAKEEQTAQLEQAQAMHDQQMQQIQATVADSTAKAMAAQDQVLQQQQTAAAMRMAFQQLRGTLLEAASAEPPPLTPTPATDAANAAASQAAGASSAPSPTNGPAGGAPNPGVPPAGMAPTGDDTVSTPASSNEPMFGGAAPTTKMEQQEPTGDSKSINSPKEVLSHYLPKAARWQK
jgi:hypothetical protein